MNKNDCDRNCDNCISLYSQNIIRDEVMELSGSDDIDGSGCDSGCALELTLTEISMAFNYLTEKLQAENERLKESIKYAIGGCEAFKDMGHCSQESKGDFESVQETLEKALEQKGEE